jgi:ElaB/YqjD/DUF883 family membrane-anchored ribosome-binding protein
MNREVYFNKDSYQAEINQLQTEIDTYKKCIGALEKITGSGELKPIEFVKDFICKQSGFPAVNQSAELLNVAEEYNFLKDNLPNVKSDKSEISQKELKEIKEKHTTRLTDELQKQYTILETIAKEYTKLSFYGYTNAIRNTDFGVYSVDCNSLHTINQLVNR